MVTRNVSKQTQPPKFSGERLQAERALAKVSRMNLARRIPEVTPTTIRRYERAGRVPSVNRALALAHALGIPIERLTDASR